MKISVKVVVLSLMTILLVGTIPAIGADNVRDYTSIGVEQGLDLGRTVHLNANGTARKIVNTNRVPNSGLPADIARQFIDENAMTLFGQSLSSAKAGGMQLVEVKTNTSKTGHHVWLQVEVDGVPVHNGYVITHLSHDGTVLFATNDLGSSLFSLGSNKATVTQSAAQSAAQAIIGGDGVTRVAPKAELVIYRTKNGDHLAWRTETATYNPYGDWEIFIDANSGDPLVSADLLVCIEPGKKPQSIEPPVHNEQSLQAPNKSTTATGSGDVFIANPLNDEPTRYGWREFEPLLPTVVDPVSLTNLDGSGLLTGLWVDVFNSSAARANEPSLIYSYDPTIVAGHFQEVNVYYHINEFQEYIQNTLGIANARSRVTDAYAHQGTDDNSDYSPSQDRIRFGDGGVDDSDDGEIVLHEYGHALHNEIVPGFVYAGETGAISEGFGDYIAASYGDNALVGEWDGTSYNPGPPPYLRRTDTSKHYPEDIVGQVHSDGEIISAAWWDFRNIVGQVVADQIIIEGMFYTGINASFQDFADGMVAADQALYGGSHVGNIFQAFGGRGIGATYLLNFDHVALGDSEDIVGPYPVVTTISHTSPITAPDAVKMFYRYGGAGAYTEVTLNPTGNFDEWGGNLPGPGINTLVEYYLTVVDDSAVTGSLPVNAPTTVMSFNIGPDAQAPVIAHNALGDQPLLTWPAAVSATITDNGAIASATVSYSYNAAPQTDLAMADLGGGLYSVAFPEAAGSLSIGDVFEYSITAVDGSSGSNTTVDGPHSFTIIDALGVVLILDDDVGTKTDEIKYDDNKNPLPPHVRDEQDKGASATSMSSILTAAGWVVTEEAATTSDPGTWGAYSFIVTSSGANLNPVADAAYRAAVEAYVAGGGKLLSEGGEVGFDAIVSPGYPSYAANVIHGFDWNSDNAGDLTVVSGQESHPIMSLPHAVGSPLAVNYVGFGDEDAYSVNPDAYVVMGTANLPGDAGIMVYDDNPNPASAQIVHYAFNFAAVNDAAEAGKMLENTALFLTANESAGTASMAGHVDVAGAGDAGVLVSVEPGGLSVTTGADGNFSFTALYGNTYTVTATLAGYGAGPQTVVLADGENATGIDFEMLPTQLVNICEPAAAAIPDNDPAGITSQILVTSGTILIDVTADIDITHTWRGDLHVQLTSPSGTVVSLHNRTGSSTDDVVGNYDGDTAVDGPGDMSDFDGESPVGFWTLSVSDNAGGDLGTLNEWCLNLLVTEMVVASDTPVLQVNADNGLDLSWEYNTELYEAFHVYRRTLDSSNAVRITDQPLSNSSGHVAFTDDTADYAIGTVLFYSLRMVRDGIELEFGDEVEITVKSSLPTVFTLENNYPNPFNPITNIKFALPRDGHVSLRVFDLSGRLVKTIVDENLSRAVHTYQWDGADESGRPMASGTYYYQVRTDRTSETGKMMLIK